MARSKVVVIAVFIVLGGIIGGLISTRNNEQKQAAISAMYQIADNTGSMKFRVGADIGRQEIKNDKLVGYGIGGIIGGLVGLICIAVTRKPS